MPPTLTRRTLLAGLPGALALAGCTPEPGPTTPTKATFVYATKGDVVTDWDPATSYSNEIIAMQNVYESLTRYDARTASVQPLLATGWRSTDRGRTWAFDLRPGVRFHTGRALDAPAAKAAIERTVALKGGAAYVWDAVETIDARTPGRLIFHCRYAVPLDLISSSAYCAYLYDVEAAGAGELKAWFGTGRDAGTGPYTVAHWAKGEETELRLAAVPDYWGGWPTPSYPAVEFRVTPQATTAWQLLQRGEISFADRLTPQLFAQAQRTTTVSTSSTPSLQNLLALLNTASGPLADVRLRRAVLAAVDQPGLITALQGSAARADGIVPAGLLGDRSGLTLTPDLDTAARLLAESGYGPGRERLTLTMTYAQGDDDQQLFATLLGTALGGLGVTLRAAPMPWNAQWDRGKSADPADRQDIFVMYWYPDDADPYSWFANVFRSADPPAFNLSYLRDARIDRLIDDLPALTATNRAAARTRYLALQRELIIDRAVVAPLLVLNYQRVYASGVQGYLDNPAYPDVVFAHDLRPGALVVPSLPRVIMVRLLHAGLVLAGVLVLTFLIARAMPGDPAVAVAGPRATVVQLAAARETLGLDRPWPVQLGRYTAGLLHGDLGTSLRTGRPVLADLARALPASLHLAGVAVTLGVVIGIPLGVLAARRHRRPDDVIIRLGTGAAAAVPVFWLALLLQQGLATGLGWLPVAGAGSGLRSSLAHLVLPAVALAAYPTGVIAQLTRAGLIEEYARDHARLERSLGFGPTRVLVGFCLRPTLNPVISLLALVFAYALVNSVLVESIFDWPGLGRYGADAVAARDTPAIAGLTVVVAVIYVGLNLTVELVQVVVDPRTRRR